MARPVRTAILSAAAGILRTLLVLAALTTTLLAVQAWIAAPKAWQPAGLTATAALAPLSALLLVIVLSAAARLAAKPKRALRDALLVVTCAGTALAVAAGRPDLTLAAILVALLMLAARPLWAELSDRRAERQGWLLLGGATLVILALFLVEWPSALFIALGTVVLLLATGAAVWGCWLLTKNAPLPLRPGNGPLRQTYAAHALAGISPFTLMQDKEYFWSRDRQAYLAYTCRTDVALVLGPGIGPAESLPQLYREFRAACHQCGWHVAYYQVSENVAGILGGARRLLGSEALVDLESLTLEGPAMAKLRHEVSRGRRNGVTVSVVGSEQLTSEQRNAIEALAAGWSARHHLGEMAFSVGRHNDQPQAPMVFGLAHDQAGRLVGYCTWLRVPAAPALALDEVRRLPEAPAGTMDLLLYSCLDQLRRQAAWASLGLAPLAGAEHAGWLARLEGSVLQRLGITSASASLFAFKGKYQPRWEPRYLVVEQTADWPAVALATFLAHYPAWATRLVQRVPSRLRLAQGQVAAAVSFALLLVGLTGIVAAAALSREGHPLYAVRSAVHAQTGLLASTGAPASVKPNHPHRLSVYTLKPPAHPHRAHRAIAHPVILHYHPKRPHRSEMSVISGPRNAGIRQFRWTRG